MPAPVRAAAPATVASSRYGGSQVTRRSQAETPAGSGQGGCRARAVSRASRHRRQTGRIWRRCRPDSPRVMRPGSSCSSGAGQDVGEAGSAGLVRHPGCSRSEADRVVPAAQHQQVEELAFVKGRREPRPQSVIDVGVLV